jgi:hypothetical protein
VSELARGALRHEDEFGAKISTPEGYQGGAGGANGKQGWVRSGAFLRAQQFSVDLTRQKSFVALDENLILW